MRSNTCGVAFWRAILRGHRRFRNKLAGDGCKFSFYADLGRNCLRIACWLCVGLYIGCCCYIYSTTFGETSHLDLIKLAILSIISKADRAMARKLVSYTLVWLTMLSAYTPIAIAGDENYGDLDFRRLSQ